MFETKFVQIWPKTTVTRWLVDNIYLPLVFIKEPRKNILKEKGEMFYNLKRSKFGQKPL